MKDLFEYFLNRSKLFSAELKLVDWQYRAGYPF